MDIYILGDDNGERYNVSQLNLRLAHPSIHSTANPSVAPSLHPVDGALANLYYHETTMSAINDNANDTNANGNANRYSFHYLITRQYAPWQIIIFCLVFLALFVSFCCCLKYKLGKKTHSHFISDDDLNGSIK